MVISSSDETIDVVVSAMVWFIYPFAFMIITAESHPTRYQEKIQELLFYCLEHEEKGQNGLALKIQTESEARVAAKELFQNVAKPGSELEMSLVLSMKDTDSIMNAMRITVFLTAAIADLVAFVPVYLTLGMVVKKINFSSITFVGLDMKEYQISGGTVRSKWRINLFRGSSTLEKMQLILSESQVLSLLKMQRLFNYSFED
ncbi:hypothetical protein DY000_02045648 [Brassica cretica]|uniref:ABC transmembrane type-1 domain-containing protein n=1 Tax=Brassica cretica TaxID=69181 RepID=A0ABQ7F416_BRACR|nr:hypothetical protein DY000_02045648 [Brassica cretica]